MKLFLPKYPAILKLLYPERLSRIASEDAIYLTFDDGPITEVTPWVLEKLAKFNAKATFFCIGDNVKKHPHIFQRIFAEGHAIGNHTCNHLNGWKTPTSEYMANIHQAENIFLQNEIENTKEENPTSKARTSNSELSTTNHELQTPNYELFRPPYGKIKNSQAKALKKQGYHIVMWDVISGDYDKDFSAENCFQNVTKNASAGSIIVLHDSKKAFKNLKILLPKLLKYYSEKGLEFRSLKDAL